MYAPERLDVTNPATGETVGAVSIATRHDVSMAFERARAAQVEWNARGFRGRAAVLRRFHDLVLSRARDVCDTVQGESGKARRDAMSEVLTVAATARYYLTHGADHLRERRRRPALVLATTARERRSPLGVVGLITPWNFPFLLGVGDAIPALLAGNAVVEKPSEMTPLAAELARELLIEAGLPADVFQLVHGPGDPVATALIEHADYVGFTGSLPTGRIVAQAAAPRMIPVSLELGGKNPMIIAPGARLGDAVWGLLNGAFPNSGHTCIATERIYVHDDIYEEFVAQAVVRVRALNVGWSTGFDMDLGSLASVEQCDRVEAFVRDAVEKGATVLAGGARRRDLGPAFFEPTLLTDVDESMDLCREETFGPIAVLERVPSMAVAIERANDTEYGLNASVWAGSVREGRAIARQLRPGSVCINATLLVYLTLDVPMGGTGLSGLGRRHGAAGRQRFTNVQSIVSSIGVKGGFESVTRAITSEGRAAALARVFRIWLRLPGVR